MNICFITTNPQATTIKPALEKLGTLAIHTKQKLSPSELVALAIDSQVLIVGPSGIEKITKEIIDSLPNLKHLALLTVGYDWVDIAHAKEKNIVVSTIKGANAESVAEHTWGMILDLTKRISEFDRDARTKGAYKFTDYKGKEIFGKTLGIIGLGDIGKKVARAALGFDMHVIGVNKSQNAVDGIQIVALDQLLVESDVIAVCAPLTPETDNMIAADQITKMKTGAILVNTSREKIVNKEAVLEAIKSGKLFGYGIETAMMTPIPADDPYFSHPRILVSPHNAFNTEEADKKSYELIVGNVKAWIDGHPQDIV